MQFAVITHYIEGKNNIYADALSRIVESRPFENAFPIQEFLKDDSDDENPDGFTFARLTTAEKRALLHKHHNALVGHCNGDALIQRIQRNGLTWKSYRRDCRQYVRNCIVCQLATRLPARVEVVRRNTSTITPFRRIQMDTIGPLEADC